MKNSGRYDISGLVEGQFEPGSRRRVLKNLLGIKLKREINRFETDTLEQTLDTLLKTYDLNYRFKVADIQNMHRLWLGDIYEWAGKYRQVNVVKDGFFFASAAHVNSLMADFEQETLKKHTPCIFKTQKRIIEALAEVHTELVLIHPFREGNGRIARVLATIMATQAGLPLLDFTCIRGRKKDEYFSAVRAGLDHNYKHMEKIFELIIQRTFKGFDRE